MEPILVIAVIVAGAVGLTVSLVAARAQRAVRVHSWRRAAAEAGLTLVGDGPTSGDLTARAGDLHLRMQEYHRGKQERGTRIVVGGLQHRPSVLAFRPESLGTPARKGWLGRSEIQLGDTAFDYAVYLQGSPDLACAVFDAETRGRLLRLMEGSPPPSMGLVDRSKVTVVLAEGELRVELREGGDWYRAPEALPSILALAERLRRPGDVAARLAGNVARDPKPAVRVRNLRALLEAYPDHALTRTSLEAARADPDHEVRLRAAVALGPPGRETLLDLAFREGPSDAQAARAVEALGDHLSVARAQEILARARGARRLATARACVESLGARRVPEVVETLAAVLATEDRAEHALAAAAAGALGVNGAAAAEGPLVKALGGDRHEVLVAVADSLARLGTAAAVLPLRDAAERVLDRDFRRAARQAIAAIQSRLTGASPGQVTMAVEEAGHVTLVDEDARGRLSVPDEAPPGPDPGKR